jgi:hypothetical protein
MTMAIDLQGASRANTEKSQQAALQQAQEDAENKKQSEALQGFKDALKQL